MPTRFLQAIAQFSFITGHVLLYGLALSIPIVLAFQTIYIADDFSLQVWIETAADLGRWGVLLWNTLIVGGLATAVAVLVGTFFALLAFKACWPGRSAMVLILLLLACVPTYVISSAAFDVVDMTAARGSTVTAGVIHGLMYIPLAAILIGLGLLCVEPELESAARLDCSALASMVFVSLPRAGWSIAAAGLVVLWLVITDYSVTNILQVNTFVEEVYTQYQLWGQRGKPFLLSLPVMFILAAAFCVLHQKMSILARPLFQGYGSNAPRITLRGRARFLATVSLFALVGCSAGAAWSLLKHLHGSAQMWTNLQAIAPEWWNTIVIAIATAAVVGLLAVGVAWLWVRSRWWRKTTALMLLALIATPAPTLGMTLSWFFNHRHPAWLMDAVQPFYNSLWITVCAVGLRFLPVGVVVVLPSVERVPPAMYESARSDGAGWLERILQIYWPQGWKGALLAGGTAPRRCGQTCRRSLRSGGTPL